MGRGMYRLFFLSVLPTMCLIICFTEAVFNPVDNYLIDCGSSTYTSVGTSVFVADNTISSLLSSPKYLFASTKVAPPPPIAGSPYVKLYQTAVIFLETSKYTFPIFEPGRLWVRLYFFPFNFGNYSMFNASFSVYAQNNLLLVSNFTNPNDTSVFFKEYSLNVTSGSLVVDFVTSPHSFAFVNGMEVVSAPPELFSGAPIGSLSTPTFHDLQTVALETVARANIGGPTIFRENDPLRRNWVAGAKFCRGPLGKTSNLSNLTGVKYVKGGPMENIAPATLYGTATLLNGTNHNQNDSSYPHWEFRVDPGFQYLLRFHFCVFDGGIQDKLSFRVCLSSRAIAQETDMKALINGTLGAPYFFEVVSELLQIDTISVHIIPIGSFPNPLAILNGLEIMKLPDSMGNLFTVSKSTRSQSKKVTLIMGLSIPLFVAALIGVTGIFFAQFRLRRKKAQLGHSKAKIFSFSLVGGGKLDSSMAIHFPFVAIEEATNNFDESWVIGAGGFGIVYKGVLRNGTKVAVKRSNPRSNQGLAEFRTEIELLSQLRNPHLVSLIGYCNERNEMILVYEFMENGTLKSHLHGSGLPTLSWEKRLEICIGAAKGLHYLHAGFVKQVIHRDVKSGNILLDENLVARVADFGLSRMVPETEMTHVSTAVRGTFGYLDPEYFRRRRLTAKSDVYSFGVVLIEVLCARPVLDPSLETDDIACLAEWAMKQKKAGKLAEIIDPGLVGKIRAESLRLFVETTEKCLAECGVDRPSMEQVLCNLESALQLQECETVHELLGDPAQNNANTNQTGELSVNSFNSVIDDRSVSLDTLFTPDE